MKSVNRASKLEDIIDVDEILEETKEERDVPEIHLQDEEPEEEEVVKEYKEPKKKSAKIGYKNNRRVIEICELDPDIIPPGSETYQTDTGSKIAIIGKPGCFAKGTKVRMYDGSIKNVEDVQVGEQVMGDDSTPRNVLELCRGRDTMFQIRPNKGQYVVVNSKHILSLMSSGTCRHKKGEILDIPLDEYLNYPNKDRYKWFKTEVSYTEKPVEVDPYTLGSVLNHDQFLKKYIPLEYKINSRKTRLTLLAGMLDLDGFLKKDGSYDLVCKSELLLNDTIEMCQSLGFYTSIIPDHSDTYYRCNIVGEKLHEIPCLLPRKQALKRRQIKNPLVSGFTVNKLEEDNYYGFILDGNHRFLLDDFSVVHNTGKSRMIKSIMWEKSDFIPIAQVYSGTEDANHSYSSFCPSTFVINGFKVPIYMDFIRRQKIAKQYLDNPWAFCIWDDLCEDERIFNLPIVKGTYKNARHWKLFHILSLQYALDIKPVIRTSIDGSFILRETNKRNRKTLFENFSSAIDDFTDFCTILDVVTNDYTALYIHNRVQSNALDKCVYYYKARDDMPEDFKFGCKEMWMFHDERYNPNYVDPIEV